MTNETPANHPRSCTSCRGTGWTATHRCEHHWTDDEPDTDNVCTIERGADIAWTAYVDECRRPNRARFDRWLAQL